MTPPKHNRQKTVKKSMSTALKRCLDEATFYHLANVCPYFYADEVPSSGNGDRALIMLYKLEKLGILKSTMLLVNENDDGTSNWVRCFRFNGMDKIPQ